MAADSVWEQLWEQLNAFFSVLVNHLQTCNAAMWSQIAHHETSAFPFTGYVSISRDGPRGDEDLVLTWSVQRHAGYLSAAADIARGNGTVLADTPVTELAEPIALSKAMEAQEQAICFFRNNLEVIKREVC